MDNVPFPCTVVKLGAEQTVTVRKPAVARPAAACAACCVPTLTAAPAAAAPPFASAPLLLASFPVRPPLAILHCLWLGCLMYYAVLYLRAHSTHARIVCEHTLCTPAHALHAHTLVARTCCTSTHIARTLVSQVKYEDGWEEPDIPLSEIARHSTKAPKAPAGAYVAPCTLRRSHGSPRAVQPQSHLFCGAAAHVTTLAWLFVVNVLLPQPPSHWRQVPSPLAPRLESTSNAMASTPPLRTQLQSQRRRRRQRSRRLRRGASSWARLCGGCWTVNPSRAQ